MYKYHDDLVSKLDLWKDRKGRKILMKEDMQIRREQNRIRKPLRRNV